MIERPKSFDFYDFQTLQIGGFHALLVAKLEREPHIGLISKLVEFCPHRVASRRPSVAATIAKTANIAVCGNFAVWGFLCAPTFAEGTAEATEDGARKPGRGARPMAGHAGSVFDLIRRASARRTRRAALSTHAASPR